MTSSANTDVASKAPTYPRIIIQPNWSVNVKSNTLPVDVWLEFKAGSASISRLAQNVHGICSIKALGNLDAKMYKTLGSDKFQSGDIDGTKQQLRIKIQDTEFSHLFQGPSQTFSTTGGNEVDQVSAAEADPLINVPEVVRRNQQAPSTRYPHWFDISVGGVGLSALSNGTITIWDINNGQVRRKLKGHTEDVYVARFFPSDFAVVSGGADMRVKIWSLDSENNHIRDETLTGHKSRINDVHALDQNRVLSASNDGSVILWDITKNEAIKKLVQLDSNSINAVSLVDGSLLACACNDGSIRLVDLNQGSTNEFVHEIKIGSTLSTICYLPNAKQIAYGTEQSAMGIYDVRQWSDLPIHAWKEQRGKINCLVPNHDQSGLIGTTSDGSCFEYTRQELETMPNTLQFHVFDYTGADDAVLNAKVFQDKIYTIARDGLLRVYDNHNEN